MNNNREIELAKQYIATTNRSLFITGKAGTGKTTFLKSIPQFTNKNTIILAPTGVAAINAGGVTIHSFFQLPFCPYLPDIKELITEYQLPDSQKQLRKSKREVIKALDLVVIDEISMVRADLLDAVDMVLRKYRRSSKPFGGVQLLMMGDLHQLPPVVKDEEKRYLDQVYPTTFFFASKALQRLDYITIELKTIYRQQDQHFVEILNKVRNNQLDKTTLSILNDRFNKNFTPNKDYTYIQLTTHNYQADKINQEKLEELHTKETILHATIEGEFPEYAMPTDNHLILKEGAQVMFVKNNMSAGYYNGKIGTIEAIDSNEGISVIDEYGERFNVGKERWENIQYETNTETLQVEAKVVGTFEQYPLKIAWAITIHKSQGLTFDHVILDAAHAFAFGQVYVALSRCRTLEGLTLSSPISERCTFDNTLVNNFTKQYPQIESIANQLERSQSQYLYDIMEELFDLSGIEHVAINLNDFAQSNLRSIYPTHCRALKEVVNTKLIDWLSINEKFKKQLHNIWIAEGASSLLNERIIKASSYYLNELKNIEPTIDSILWVDLDNKDHKTKLNDFAKRWTDTYNLKYETLSVVNQKGFSVENYMHGKTAALLKEEEQPKKKIKKISSISNDNPDLLLALKNWRSLEASERKIPPAYIITLKTLQTIASEMPKNLKELNNIKGIGKITIQRYGDILLRIVKDYNE